MQLTLDLRAVCFLDPTGLRMILRWDAKSRADGFTFSLVAGPPTVQRLFDLTRTTERLSFEASPAGGAAETHNGAMRLTKWPPPPERLGRVANHAPREV